VAALKEAKLLTGVLAFISLLIILLAYISASDALGRAMPVVIYVVSGISIVVAIVWGIVTCFIRVEQARTFRAQLLRDRKLAAAEVMKAEAEAAVMVITAPKGHQLVVRDGDKKSHYRQLHLNPMPVVNARYEKPTDLQVQMYRQYQGLPAGEPIVIDQPPNDVLNQYSPDWLRSLILPAPHVHYCGATRSGKTMLANHHLTSIAEKNPKAEIRLINPKHTAARKPFIINPDYSDIEQVLEGLQVFNSLMLKRKNDPALNGDSHKIIFVIDEWDWIYETYGNSATRLLIPLVKVGAELNLQVLLIGQSPLTGDTGLSQSFYHNMVRVAIWQEGARLLNNYPLDRKYKAPLMARYEELKSLAASYKNETGQELRYCVTVPMAGNPSVQVIPFLEDPQPIRQKALPTVRPLPGSYDMSVCQAWYKVSQNKSPSGNKMHQLITGNDVRINGRQKQNYIKILKKYGFEPGFLDKSL
jgi:hypothetical protein